MRMLQPSLVAGLISSISNATLYSASAIPVRRSSPIGLCCPVRNTIVCPCSAKLTGRMVGPNRPE